jgi:hypothetical protein
LHKQLQLHPRRLGSEALRILQRWGKFAYAHLFGVASPLFEWDKRVHFPQLVGAKRQSTTLVMQMDHDLSFKKNMETPSNAIGTVF